MEQFAEWTFEGGLKFIYQRVGAAGNRTRYQSGVHIYRACESGHYVKVSGTAIIDSITVSDKI